MGSHGDAWNIRCPPDGVGRREPLGAVPGVPVRRSRMTHVGTLSAEALEAALREIERAAKAAERQARKFTHGRQRPRCLAYARTTGRPCQAKVVPGRTRCKLHGGASTGPRTEAGRRRVGEAARARMLRYWEQWRRERQRGSTDGQL